MPSRGILVFVPVLILAAGCGGERDDPVGPEPVAPTLQSLDIAGTVSGPRDPAGLQVLGSSGEGTVAEDGGYALTILEGGAHLAVVADAGGEAVYLGLLDGDHTAIDVASTARALLYYAVGGPLLPGEIRATVHDDPDFLAGAAVLAQTIQDAYEAGGADLVDIADQLTAAIAALPLFAPDAGKTLVDPPDGGSGIDIDTTVEDQITLRNNYRRRALAWVDLVEGVSSEGTTYAYGQEQAEVNISPTVGYSSIVGTLVDAVQGNFMWAPVASPPIPTPVRPHGGLQATYRVTVLGLGGSRGDFDGLDQERAGRYGPLALRSIVTDFVAPIVLTFVLPQYNAQLDDFLGWAEAHDVFADMLNLLSQAAPSIVDKALAGDLDGAIHDTFNALQTSQTVQDAHLACLRQSIETYFDLSGQQHLIPNVGPLFRSAARILMAVNVVGTVLDSARQSRDILFAKTAERWDVVVTAARLTLTPARLQMQPGETGSLTVTVQDAGDRAFEYRWRCGDGALSDALGHQGQEIVTSRQTVSYHAPSAGEDVVVVEVHEIVGADRRRLGEASAPVDVREARPFLAPRRVSLPAGDWEVFEIRMAPGYQGEGRLFYSWTGADRHGAHDGAAFVNTERCVTYAAASEGVDTLACEVFLEVNGRLESLGAATAEIRVEQEPTIIQGHYYSHSWPEDGGARCCVYADVVWASVADAVGYRLYGYGGFDPEYYLAGPITRTIDADHVQHDHAAEMPAGEVWTTLSRYCGPIANEGWGIAYMDGRFASGWAWEVEVIRR